MQLIHWENLYDLQLLVCMVFVFYYIYTLVMLASSRHQLVIESVFFIFISTGIFDILLCTCHQFLRASARLGLGPQFHFLHLLANNFMDISYWVHVSGNFLMACCQYTAVCWPLVHKRIWLRNRAFIYFLAGVLAAISISFEGWFLKATYTRLPDGSYSSNSSAGAVLPQGVFIVAIVIISIYVISVTILTSTTLLKIKELQLPKHISNHYRTLVFVISVDFFLIFLEMLYDIRWLMNKDAPEWFAEFIDYTCNFNYSMIYVSNPVVLVILNRTARSQVFRPFRSSTVTAR